MSFKSKNFHKILVYFSFSNYCFSPFPEYCQSFDSDLSQFFSCWLYQLLLFLPHQPYSFCYDFVIKPFCLPLLPALAGRCSGHLEDCLPSIHSPLPLRCPISHLILMTALGLWSELVSKWTTFSESCFGPQLVQVSSLETEDCRQGLGHSGRLGMLLLQPCEW